MALFKVSTGLSQNLPSDLTEGCCWYTYDDSKFYIDYKDKDGNIVRKVLNAQDSETLMGKSLVEIQELLLSSIENNFADVSHTHAVSNIDNLQSALDSMQDNIDAIEQAVADLEGNTNPGASFETETLTFTLVDGTVVTKQILVK